MKKYPINVEEYLLDYEKVTGNPLEKPVRELLSLYVSNENAAYQQGLVDGFAGTFSNSRTLAKISDDCLEAQNASDKLQASIHEVRDVILDEFENHGFSNIINTLGQVPAELNWGQKIYTFVQEAYIHGFLLAFSTITPEDDNAEAPGKTSAPFVA